MGADWSLAAPATTETTAGAAADEAADEAAATRDALSGIRELLANYEALLGEVGGSLNDADRARRAGAWLDRHLAATAEGAEGAGRPAG